MRRQSISIALVISALAALSLYGFGCNPFQAAKDKINEKVTEGILGQVTGGKVDIKNGGTQVTYKDSKTGGTTAFGEDVKLPDDFPKSVLIYPGSKISGVTVSHENGESAWVMFYANDEVSKVVEWYGKETKEKGWKEESNLAYEQTVMRTYSQGNETMSVNVGPSDDASKGKSTVIVTWELQPKASDTSSSN
jgi:hypothetical protein